MEVYSRLSYLSLPSKPGVYEFLDSRKRVLYVGKAIDLKARVSSYFKTTQLGEKTKLLVSEIKKIQITIVESELEALLLEAYYIKKYNPKFNIRLTDNKAYILVRITVKDAYPRVLLARRMHDAFDEYFGPFPNSSSVKLVLKTIRKVFPFVSVPNHPKRICLYNHLGLCPCPTVFDSVELRKEYRKNIRSILRIFEGKAKKIMSGLEKKRDKLSAQEKFEEAAGLQKRINALSYITQPIHTPYEYVTNPNLRSDLRKEEMVGLQNVLQDNGCPVVSLRKIECFDISNIQGKNATGSMVVFIDGEKEGSLYRKFKIRMENKPDDFAMMAEVIRRRLRHLEWDYPDLMIVDGGKGQVSAVLHVLQEKYLHIPLIGLAKREETIVIPILRPHSNSTKDPSAKPQDDKLFFKEVALPKDSKALHLIMRIRDEAHRFALIYHQKLRSTAVLQ